MTRDDIIRLAQQTGWDFGYEMCVEHVCEFAALVAAAEREACAQVCDRITWSNEAKFFAAAIRQRENTND
jgi:hypothetical protein